MTVSAKRDEARGDERRVVDRRLIAELEVALEPSRRDARVPLRLLLGDQDRQLEQLGEGRPAERAKCRLGHLKVLTLDRPVENRPWMTLRSRGAFPGPDGSASLASSQCDIVPLTLPTFKQTDLALVDGRERV